MKAEKRQTAYLRNVSLDVLSITLSTICALQVLYGIHQAGGWNQALPLLAANPLLGGDAEALLKSGQELPMFTYIVGHCVPGVILQLIGQTLFYFLFQEWKTVPSHEREDGRALLTTVVTLAGSAPLLSPFYKLTYESHYSKLYFHLDDYPLWWAVVSTLMTSFFIESFFWWMHYLAHANKWFYDNIHSVHHSFVPSTASCASAFHPLDIVLLTLGSVFVSLTIPIHGALHSGYLLFSLFWSLMVHCGFRGRLPKWLTVVFNDSNMHCLHHDFGRRPVNLGSLLCVWDHLMGTHRTELTAWSVVAQSSKKGQDLKTK